MKKVIIYCLFSGLILAFSCKTKYVTFRYYKDFDFIEYNDTIDIVVWEFWQKNKGLCFQSGGWPYALIIATTNISIIENDTITVLAICDNNIYNKGEKLKIVQLKPDEIGNPVRLIRLFKDTVINNIEYRHYIGSEYPAICGKVVK